MRARLLDIVVLGLSITSSWGNGHATTYRALLKHFNRRGHHTLFLERDRPWYTENRDLPNPDFCTTRIYSSLEQLREVFSAAVRRADAVIVGSFVPDGVQVGEWALDTAEGVTAFYDIDTPVTLDRLQQGDCEYIAPLQIPRYDAYLSSRVDPGFTA